MTLRRAGAGANIAARLSAALGARASKYRGRERV